jgi:hypothetical protein
MTTPATSERFLQLSNKFNSITRETLYAWLGTAGNLTNLQLAVLDAMLQHRVYSTATIARTANLQGHKLDKKMATMVIGQVCDALAIAAGWRDEVTEYGTLQGEGRCAHSLLAHTVGGDSIKSCMRDADGDMIWALRPGLSL